jgi:cysteine desulfurase
MALKTPIYLDHAATTPCDPRVVEAMMPYFTQTFGNPGSRNHSFGWEAEAAVSRAREQVASMIAADPKEIVFTSGSTEANNLALKGAAEMYEKSPAGTEHRGHIITCAIEHKAVLDPAKRLQKEGFDVTFLEPPRDAIVTRKMVEEAMREDTILVSIMWANNEMGTINEVPEIGALCHERDVVFHTDATQWVGKMPVSVKDDNIDLLSMSGHKIYGPKGVGALFVRRRKPRVRLSPQIHGGGHERGNRSGTLNVPGIVGFGAAAKLARESMADEATRIASLRNHLLEQLRAKIPHIHVNGAEDRLLPGHLNVSFAYIEGESLLMALKDVALSSGSACTSASLEPSYVLRAMGVNDELAHSSLRMTIGRFTTKDELDYVVELLDKHVDRLREMSPLWEMVQEGIDLNSIEWTAH